MEGTKRKAVFDNVMVFDGTAGGWVGERQKECYKSCGRVE